MMRSAFFVVSCTGKRPSGGLRKHPCPCIRRIRYYSGPLRIRCVNTVLLNAGDDSYQLDSDRFLVSSNYLSINNITIGYTFPEKWLKKLHIASLRVYATGDNLWVFSARRGLDPRMFFGGTGGSINNGNFTYSSMRNISGGITLTF